MPLFALMRCSIGFFKVSKRHNVEVLVFQIELWFWQFSVWQLFLWQAIFEELSGHPVSKFQLLMRQSNGHSPKTRTLLVNCSMWYCPLTALFENKGALCNPTTATVTKASLWHYLNLTVSFSTRGNLLHSNTKYQHLVLSFCWPIAVNALVIPATKLVTHRCQLLAFIHIWIKTTLDFDTCGLNLDCFMRPKSYQQLNSVTNRCQLANY
jgi:hypothetical protein